jgi:hypothetical protein
MYEVFYTFRTIAFSHTIPYLYVNLLPEDEPSGSKHVDDIKIKIQY